jgi:hypothetical protein
MAAIDFRWSTHGNIGLLTWYGSDGLYIDYSDGYYLYNRRYPGVGIAVIVTL